MRRLWDLAQKEDGTSGMVSRRDSLPEMISYQAPAVSSVYNGDMPKTHGTGGTAALEPAEEIIMTVGDGEAQVCLHSTRDTQTQEVGNGDRVRARSYQAA